MGLVLRYLWFVLFHFSRFRPTFSPFEIKMYRILKTLPHSSAAGRPTTSADKTSYKLQAHFDDDIGFTQDEMEKPEAFFARFDVDKDNRITREELPQSQAREVFKWVYRTRDDQWDPDEFKILLRPAGDSRNIMVAIKTGGDGLLNETDCLAWERSNPPYVATPLISRERVYLVKSLGVITCLNSSTGAPYFEGERTGVKGEYYASPVKVGNRIFITSNLGIVIILRDIETFEILAKNNLED
jgi:hypothetical protein